MSQNTDTIRLLQNQVIQKSALKNQFFECKDRIEQLQKNLFSLKINMHNQQVDVDLLNMFSLKNLFYDVTGKKEAMLAKKEQEARAAKAAHDNAVFQLEQLNRQIEAIQIERNNLAGCEKRYWDTLTSALDTAVGEERTYILELMTERSETVLTELRSASLLCRNLFDKIEGIQENIRNIQDWNLALTSTAWSISIPGYLLGVQKKMDDLKKETATFLEKAEGLPLPASLPKNADEIFIFPEHYLQEIVSKSTADQRLREAYDAAYTARISLQELSAQLDDAISKQKLTLQELVRQQDHT